MVYIITPILISAVALRLFDREAAIIALVLSCFVSFLVRMVVDSTTRDNACIATCLNENAPYAYRDRGMCWCYRTATEQFAVPVGGE